MALVRAQGVRGLTIEAIAATAGVGKNTIYRWWKNPPAVVLEALIADTSAAIAVPDTGDAVEDVRALLSQAFARLTHTEIGDVVRGLMAESQFDHALAQQMRETFIADRRTALATLLERGQRHGRIGRSLDINLAIDLFYGAMWYRLLNGHAPLDDQFAGDLVRAVLPL